MEERAVSESLTNLDAEALIVIRSDLVTAEGRLYDHVATTFRWIMAALFAANGGAIVAVLASENPLIGTNMLAIRFFAAGLLFSILVGVLSAIWGLRASMRLATIRGKVDICLLQRVSDKEIVPALMREKVNWKTFVPSYAAGIAFLSLILGVLAIASRL